MNVQVERFPSAPLDVHGNPTTLTFWHLWADGKKARTFNANARLPLIVEGNFSPETEFQFSAENEIGEGVRSESVRGKVVQGVPEKPESDFMLRLMRATSGPKVPVVVAPSPTVPQFDQAAHDDLMAKAMDTAIAYVRLAVAGDHPARIGPHTNRRPGEATVVHDTYNVGQHFWHVVTSGTFDAGAGPTYPTPTRIQGTATGDFVNTVTITNPQGLAVGDKVSCGYGEYKSEVTSINGDVYTFSDQINARLSAGGQAEIDIDFLPDGSDTVTDGTAVLQYSHSLETLMTSPLTDRGGWDSRADYGQDPDRYGYWLRLAWGTNNDSFSFLYYDSPTIFDEFLTYDARKGNTYLTDDQRAFMDMGLSRLCQAALYMRADVNAKSKGFWNYTDWLIAEYNRSSGRRIGPIFDQALAEDWLQNRMAFYSELEFGGSLKTNWATGNSPAPRIPVAREIGLMCGAYANERATFGARTITVDGVTEEFSLWLMRLATDVLDRMTLFANANVNGDPDIGQEAQPFYKGLITYGLGQLIRGEVAGGRDPARFFDGSAAYDITPSFQIVGSSANASQAIVTNTFAMATSWLDYQGNPYFKGGGVANPNDQSTWASAPQFSFIINSRNGVNPGSTADHPILNALVAQCFVAAAIEIQSGRATAPNATWTWEHFLAFGDKLITQMLSEVTVDTLASSGPAIRNFDNISKQNSQIVVWAMKYLRLAATLPGRVEN